MPAFRARAWIITRRGRVESIAPATMKGPLATLPLKTPMVSPIVPQPKRDKYHGHQHAVGNGEDRQLQHAGVLADLPFPASTRE